VWVIQNPQSLNKSSDKIATSRHSSLPCNSAKPSYIRVVKKPV
jgi:hypothetical protein